MKYWIATITAIVIASGIFFLVKQGRSWITTYQARQGIPGTNLKLVGGYEPLHIFIYADTTSTNKNPDYAVFHGNEPVILRETDSSNKVETTYFENGLYVLKTIHDENGLLLERSVNHSGDSGYQKYGYVDKNGDGLWDIFIRYGQNGERTTMLTQSNLCWVPIPSAVKSKSSGQP